MDSMKLGGALSLGAASGAGYELRERLLCHGDKNGSTVGIFIDPTGP